MLSLLLCEASRASLLPLDLCPKYILLLTQPNLIKDLDPYAKEASKMENLDEERC